MTSGGISSGCENFCSGKHIGCIDGEAFEKLLRENGIPSWVESHPRVEPREDDSPEPDESDESRDIEIAEISSPVDILSVPQLRKILALAKEVGYSWVNLENRYGPVVNQARDFAKDFGLNLEGMGTYTRRVRSRKTKQQQNLLLVHDMKESRMSVKQISDLLGLSTESIYKELNQ